MIIIDANLLLYATIRESPDHGPARDWLDDQLYGTSRVGLPWASLLAFVRIATNPRISQIPLTLDRAWGQVTDWLERDSSWVPGPTERHAETLGPLLRTAGLRANDVADVHLAAIAMEHGLLLCSADAGFARFEGLRWKNPIA
jgi:toxin-antitoxin system PIN domain toxin